VKTKPGTQFLKEQVVSNEKGMRHGKKNRVTRFAYEPLYADNFKARLAGQALHGPRGAEAVEGRVAIASVSVPVVIQSSDLVVEPQRGEAGGQRNIRLAVRAAHHQMSAPFQHPETLAQNSFRASKMLENVLGTDCIDRIRGKGQSFCVGANPQSGWIVPQLFQADIEIDQLWAIRSPICAQILRTRSQMQHQMGTTCETVSQVSETRGIPRLLKRKEPLVKPDVILADGSQVS
jgi:hypothetical protein